MFKCRSVSNIVPCFDYCEHLVRRFGADGRLRPFVAPLGPFLDPGSRAFEQPGLGYRTFCRSLEDHRRAFLGTFEGVASRLTVARGLLAAGESGGEHTNRVAAELASHGTMFGRLAGRYDVAPYSRPIF